MRTITAADKNTRKRYDPKPVLRVPGLEVLARRDIEHGLAELASGQVLVIDGFLGIDWDSIQIWLRTLSAFDCFEFIDARSAMCPQDEIEERIRPYIGDPDPVFGKLFPGELEQFFDPKRLSLLRDRARRNTSVVFGSGAGLVSESGPVVYLDVSKESLQTYPVTRLNLGQTTVCEEKFYKRAYFVDWPVLERHRNALRNRIKLWIDSNGPHWLGLQATDLERAIRAASERPFRPKPWFLPGPWGGQFLKHHIGIGKSLPNIAWSYELIASENGVLIGEDSAALELPFSFILEANPTSILGAEVAARFANQFPIRFDYLDTISGGNLSCQCHPSDEFIQTNFGELFTQNESYYIVESEPESYVYLGFREECDPVDFWRAARRSQREGREFEIADHLNAWPSKKHDIFLIPNGTVHCSGSGNLVLEISATPYIYTFKIYDYLRPDLKGSLRHLHIDYAERNAHAERTTAWVRDNLIPGRKMLFQGPDWQEFVISDHPLLFYDIRRVDFSSRVRQQTDGGVTVVNLVEGEEADIISASGTLRIHYAETAVIPARTEVFELVNRGATKARLLKAFVRPCGMKQDLQPYVVGVDLGGTYLRIAVIEPRSGRIIRVSKQESASLNVNRFCDALARSIRPHQARVSAFGIGIPGFCDKQRRRVVTTWRVVPFLENCDLASKVEHRFGVRVMVDNDARVHALGEYRYGGWGKPRSLVVLTLGTGVGLAWHIDGLLYPPPNHGAMGGHMAIAYQSGNPCYCGAIGCLESLASGNALAAAANERLARFLTSGLEMPVSAEDVCCAGRTDDLARTCISRVIESLRCALHNLHHLYFPDVVVLGGGLAQGLVPYLGKLRNWFHRLARFDGRRNRLVVSRLGDKAGLLGAAALICEGDDKLKRAGANS